MNKYLYILLLVAVSAGNALAMVGGPVFVVPPQMTSMTVEGGQYASEFASAAGSGDDQFQSQRVGLTARFGVAPGVDLGATVGTANMTFSDLGGGFGNYTANWSLAWGASVHAGLPAGDQPYQLVGSLHYAGFQPTGKTSNGLKTISTEYLWHEVSPALVGGYRFGPVIPYLGVMKPFLFGRKEVKVSFLGQDYESAGGTTNYTDTEQSLRGLAGIEWKLPEGYSVSAEAATGPTGQWTLTVGLAQMLR